MAEMWGKYGAVPHFPSISVSEKTTQIFGPGDAGSGSYAELRETVDIWASVQTLQCS
jgi:hypothetical protein